MTDAEKKALGGALPEAFDFYHLGQVSLHNHAEHGAGAVSSAPIEALLDGCATVGFSLQGDIKGLLVVAFEKDLDFSTYTELGNVVASQLVTQLSRRDQLDVMISPPRRLSAERLERLLPVLRAPGTVIRTYLHRLAGKAEIPVHVLISVGETSENV